MHARGEPTTSKHQVRIIDGDALRSVLQRVLEESGSHRKAAAALKIGQWTFTKLLRGTVHKRIRFDTYSSIRDALRHIEFGLDDEFQDSVLTYEGWFVKNHYESWLRQEFERLERKLRSVFEELFSHADYQVLFKRFLERVTRRSELPLPEDQRLWIALYRAVEPLGDAEVTWGVERTWQEMDEAKDLHRFLRAALERERIMLNRERDLDRLSDLRPPDEYLAELAGPNEEGARYMPPEKFFARLDDGEDAGGESIERA